MRDPVVTADGHTYERAAIERWLRDHGTSPQTNEVLPYKHVVPNHALRKQIADYRDANGMSPPRPWIPPPDMRRGGDAGAPNEGLDACPSLPGWVVAAVFLAVWLMAWAAGEITVAKEVTEGACSSCASAGRGVQREGVRGEGRGARGEG